MIAGKKSSDYDLTDINHLCEIFAVTHKKFGLLFTARQKDSNDRHQFLFRQTKVIRVVVTNDDNSPGESLLPKFQSQSGLI